MIQDTRPVEMQPEKQTPDRMFQQRVITRGLGGGCVWSWAQAWPGSGWAGGLNEAECCRDSAVPGVLLVETTDLKKGPSPRLLPCSICPPYCALHGRKLGRIWQTPCLGGQDGGGGPRAAQRWQREGKGSRPHGRSLISGNSEHSFSRCVHVGIWAEHRKIFPLIKKKPEI